MGSVQIINKTPANEEPLDKLNAGGIAGSRKSIMATTGEYVNAYLGLKKAHTVVMINSIEI
jgi:hypothetical protein